MSTPMPEPPQDLPEFSDAQVEALVSYMIDAGKSRGQAQGAAFSEVDYLAGCMATLFALRMQNHIPAMWIFGVMAGRSPLDLPTLDQDVYVLYNPEARPVEKRVTVYAERGEAEEHLGYLINHGNDNAELLHVPARHALRPEVAQALEAEDLTEDLERK